jgi:DMSO/TMAO reductase YedYZ molybdopterin-dependent catalytic subunit
MSDTDFDALFKGKPGSVLGNHRDPEPVPARQKLTETKIQWAKEKRQPTSRPWQQGHKPLPPGQSATADFPVLDQGHRPLVGLQDWRLTISGAVARPLAWDWDAFLAAPQTTITSDIHCVTAWSRYDNAWTGVAGKTLLDMVQPKPEAKFLIFHSHDGYTTNLPITRLAEDDAMLAHTWQGEPLSREHGGPARIVISSLYFWKSAKWVKHISVLENDVPGYWETRGYHNDGDPWKQQRYG